jgi:hypothetical protein
MKIEKLKVTESDLNLNLKFYFFLKNLVKSKLSDAHIYKMLEIIDLYHHTSDAIVSELIAYKEKNTKNSAAQDALDAIVDQIKSTTDSSILSFAMKLFIIKDLLLNEAKIIDLKNQDQLKELNPLSLSYDNISVFKPYTRRVNGALLSLLFFSYLEQGKTNFISQDAHDFILSLSEQAIALKKIGLEPNQIFMLMFSESVNQSILSQSGSNFEDRIRSVLIKIGIPADAISKEHDKNDASMEYDFFFELNKKKFGISAKRTLRERYKQSIQTTKTTPIDVHITITLGLDLNETKAETMRSHNIILFVSDEIYQSRPFLQSMDGVYSVKDLTLKTLESF